MSSDTCTRRAEFGASSEVQLLQSPGTAQEALRTCCQFQDPCIVLTIACSKLLCCLRGYQEGSDPRWFGPKPVKPECHHHCWRNRWCSHVESCYPTRRSWCIFVAQIIWLTKTTLQVLKSRIQSAPTGTYNGLLDCARKTIAADGAGALWKGFGPAMARVSASLMGEPCSCANCASQPIFVGLPC